MGVAVAVAGHAEEVAWRSATLLESTGTSCDWTTKWIACCGLSGPATLLIGIAIETRRPERTRLRRLAHLLRRDEVHRPELVVRPQRPQFFTDSKIASNSGTPTLFVSATRSPLL